MNKRKISKEAIDKILENLIYKPDDKVKERVIWGYGYYDERGNFKSGLLEAIDKAMKEKVKEGFNVLL